MTGIHRAHEKVGDQADHQQNGHQVEGDVVGLTLGNSGLFLRGGKVIDQCGSDKGGDRPGRDQSPVDGAHLMRAKQIAEISGNRREAQSAVDCETTLDAAALLVA